MPDVDFDGPLYRALNPVFAREPLSGEGARRFGGRFNRVGRPALYLTPDFDVLRREVARGGRFQPSVVIEVEARLSGLFDATDREALAGQGLSPGEIALDDWRLRQRRGEPVPSQELAERLAGQGVPGLVAPSFAPGGAGGRVVVLWRWEEAEDVRLRLVDDGGRLA